MPPANLLFWCISSASKGRFAPTHGISETFSVNMRGALSLRETVFHPLAMGIIHHSGIGDGVCVLFLVGGLVGAMWSEGGATQHWLESADQGNNNAR